jgi:RNA polymerase sigma-70 factor (ECF subfamily)
VADQEQFLRLFLKNEDQIKAFLRMLVRDRSDYDDVCQSVAMTLWRKFGKYDESRPFGPWARGVAVKEVLQMRRESARCPTPFPAEVVGQLLEAFEKRVAASPDTGTRLDALQQCLDALPAQSLNCVQLRYRESFSIPDIASRIGSTAVATQRALSRIRVRLAECIDRRLAVLQEVPR